MYRADEVIAKRQLDNKPYVIMHIIKRDEVLLTYHYLVLWKETMDNDRFLDIFCNALDYSVDIRQLPNFKTKYANVFGFMAMKFPEKEIIPIITEAVRSGVLNPI